MQRQNEDVVQWLLDVESTAQLVALPRQAAPGAAVCFFFLLSWSSFLDLLHVLHGPPTPFAPTPFAAAYAAYSAYSVCLCVCVCRIYWSSFLDMLPIYAQVQRLCLTRGAYSTHTDTDRQTESVCEFEYRFHVDAISNGGDGIIDSAQVISLSSLFSLSPYLSLSLSLSLSLIQPLSLSLSSSLPLTATRIVCTRLLYTLSIRIRRR
jgi:hypothetical protein